MLITTSGAPIGGDVIVAFLYLLHIRKKSWKARPDAEHNFLWFKNWVGFLPRNANTRVNNDTVCRTLLKQHGGRVLCSRWWWKQATPISQLSISCECFACCFVSRLLLQNNKSIDLNDARNYAVVQCHRWSLPMGDPVTIALRSSSICPVPTTRNGS